MAPARPIPGLDCEGSFRTAAGLVLWTRFEEMMSFSEAALAGENPEGIHDMRVGSRRLRAAVELFQDAFPRRRMRPLLKTVKTLADTLGEVRDLDVQLEAAEKDKKGRPAAQRGVLEELMAELEAQRVSARAALQTLLDRLDRENFSREFLSFVAREAM